MNNIIHNLIKEVKKQEIIAKELNIFEIFKTENIFLIKEFQRKYEWGKFQSNELLNEINENKKNTYFLGMMILKKENIINNQVSLGIIDGQQRITTLFLISKVLEINIKKYTTKKFVEEIKDKEIDEKEKKKWKAINKLKNIYSFNQNGNIPKLKISKIRGEKELIKILIKNEFDDENYDAINRNDFNPIYSQSFKNILDWFSNKDINFILNFYEKIKNIYFSVVILGQQINEYKVFEDLNSKGIDLKIDDLIRNFFAQKATLFDKESAQKTIDNYELLLNKVEIFLKNEKKQYRGYFSEQIGRWFKNYILYKLEAKRTMSDTNDKRMYGLYKEEVNNKITKSVSLLEEINLIQQYLEFCEWINEPNDNYKYLVNDIEMYPIFFEFYKNAKKRNYNLNNLQKIFSLIYISTICSNKNLKKLNKKYLEEIKKSFYSNNNFEMIVEKILIYMSLTKQNVIQIIQKKIAEDSVILNEPKMKKFIFYFFAKMISKNKKIILDEGYYNIEHIIPQEPDFSLIDDQNEKEKMQNLWFVNVNRLKNLALIEKDLNDKLENKFYSDKRDIILNLENNNISDETKKIYSNEKFENNELEKRFIEIKEFSKSFSQEIINWKKE